jgi:hypothetical protein
LTDIPFESTLSYILKQKNYEINEVTLYFLYSPILLPYFKLTSYTLQHIEIDLKNVSIRKTQFFLNELNQVINEKEIYKNNERIVISFFLLKHFFL